MELLKSNSGLSSKSYVMIQGVRLAKVIVYWYLGVLTVEMFTNYVLRSDWIQFVAVIGALSTFILASAWGKVRGEQSYNSNYGYQNTSINSEITGEEVDDENI